MTKKHASCLLVLTLMSAVTGVRAAAQAPATPSVVHNAWSSGAAIPMPVYAPAAAVLGNEIYVIGGLNASGDPVADVQIFNPATNDWSSGTPLPIAVWGASAAVVHGVLYVFFTDTWAYSTKTKSWTTKTAPPMGTGGAAGVVKNNVIYLIGAGLTATVQSYNPATDTWVEETPLLSSKYFPGAGLLGTTIVAADGAVAPGYITGDTEGYDATTNSWTELATDPTARQGPCFGAVGSKFYGAGGYLNNGGAAAVVNESFQLSTNKWKSLAPMPQGVMSPASAVYKGRL